MRRTAACRRFRLPGFISRLVSAGDMGQGFQSGSSHEHCCFPYFNSRRLICGGICCYKPLILIGLCLKNSFHHALLLNGSVVTEHVTTGTDFVTKIET